MSQSAKIGMWVAIVVVVVGGLWIYSSRNGNVQTPPPQDQMQGTSTTPQSNANNSSGNTAAISAQNSSDASINQDLGTIDTQMNSLSSDSANVDKGMNDTPVAQDQ